MKVKEKRIVKGYKIKNSLYNKAKKRADKDKLKLATLIEIWVISYAHRLDYLIEGNPTYLKELINANPSCKND